MKPSRSDIMRNEILLAVKANGVPTTGDLFFALAFRTEAELASICRELCIKVPDNENNHKK